MVDSGGEDPRKKRDNAQVHNDHEEKPKKVHKASKSLKSNTEPTNSSTTQKTTIDIVDKEVESSNDEDEINAAILPSPAKRRATVRNSTVASTSKPILEPTQQNPAKSYATTNTTSTQSAKRSNTNRLASQISSSGAAKHDQSFQKSRRKIWDLESAMLHLVRMSQSETNSDIQPEADTIDKNVSKLEESSDEAVQASEKEYLTPKRDYWVSFSMAHAGDAATIATWYQQFEQQAVDELSSKNIAKEKHAHDVDDNKAEIDTKPPPPVQPSDVNDVDEVALPGASSSLSPSMLEHWLAEGLGDEVTCPSVYGLLAHVHSHIPEVEQKIIPTKDKGSEKSKHLCKKKASKAKSVSSLGSQPKMAAVVLLTVAWTSNERHLRVEWMGVDPALASNLAIVVQQKVWLRISTLSVMTACPVIAVDEKLLSSAASNANHGNRETDKEDGKNSSGTTTRIVPSAE